MSEHSGSNRRRPWIVALAVVAFAYGIGRGLLLVAAFAGGIAAPSLWLAELLQVVGALLAGFAWMFRPGLVSIALVVITVGVTCELLFAAFLHGTFAPLPALALIVLTFALLFVLIRVTRDS